MKSFLLKILNSKGGKIASWVAALIVSQLALLAAKFGWQIDPSDWAKVTVGITTGIVSIIETWAGSINAAGVREMQKALHKVNSTISNDGWAGKVTVGSVQALVATHKGHR